MVDSHANSSNFVKKIFKILVVGEMCTGKTSIIREYTQNYFTEFYKSTIGIDFSSKDLTWDEEKLITSLQFWDIAGQERNGGMTHVYYQQAVAALVVFDVTRQPTFDLVREWKKDIDSKVFTSSNMPIPCLLLGNKIDILKGELEEDMNAYCKEHGFVGFLKHQRKQD
jgi:small GTP-binding protein